MALQDHFCFCYSHQMIFAYYINTLFLLYMNKRTFLFVDQDICYFFGFFLPLGETVADKIKNEVRKPNIPTYLPTYLPTDLLPSCLTTYRLKSVHFYITFNFPYPSL